MSQSNQKKNHKKTNSYPKKPLAKFKKTPIHNGELFGGHHLAVGKKDQVFVAHGHDEASLYKVVDFLKAVGLGVIVLKDEPGGGKTIIEKFETYSGVDFVVALLTADDKGGNVSKPPEEQKPRAGQNVIFELGFFAGKLGRKKVRALVAPGIEIPSDFHGVECIALDQDGGWQWKLGKELKAAGLKLDLNGASNVIS